MTGNGLIYDSTDVQRGQGCHDGSTVRHQPNLHGVARPDGRLGLGFWIRSFHAWLVNLSGADGIQAGQRAESMSRVGARRTRSERSDGYLYDWEPSAMCTFLAALGQSIAPSFQSTVRRHSLCPGAVVVAITATTIDNWRDGEKCHAATEEPRSSPRYVRTSYLYEVMLDVLGR